MNKFPPSAYQVELDLIVDFLSTVKPNTSVTYDQISAAANINVQKHYFLLSRARKKLIEDRIVFAVNKGVGFTRLDSEKALAVGTSHINKAGRVAKKGIKVIESAEYNELSEPNQLKYNVSMTVLNVLKTASHHSTQKKLSAAVKSPTPKTLPLVDTLVLLSR